MAPEDNPADDDTDRDQMIHEIRLLTEQRDALLAACECQAAID
jgi:hypothetical protein